MAPDNFETTFAASWKCPPRR